MAIVLIIVHVSLMEIGQLFEAITEDLIVNYQSIELCCKIVLFFPLTMKGVNFYISGGK